MKKEYFRCSHEPFSSIWVPSLLRSIHARLDNLDNTIASLAGFRSRVVGIVQPTLNFAKLCHSFDFPLSSLFVFSPFFFETRLRRDDDDDICDDSKAYKEYQNGSMGASWLSIGDLDCSIRSKWDATHASTASNRHYYSSWRIHAYIRTWMSGLA